MAGTVCHEHFVIFGSGALRVKCDHRESGMCPSCYETYRAKHDAFDAECDACEACTTARAAWFERIQRTQTIDPDQPYGEHILLKCAKHPWLRWHTKNIDFIGARTLFFKGSVNPDEAPEECPCSTSFLEVVK